MRGKVDQGARLIGHFAPHAAGGKAVVLRQRRLYLLRQQSRLYRLGNWTRV